MWCYSICSPLSDLWCGFQLSGWCVLCLLLLPEARVSPVKHMLHYAGSHVENKSEPREAKDDPNTCKTAVQEDVVLPRVGTCKEKKIINKCTLMFKCSTAFHSPLDKIKNVRVNFVAHISVCLLSLLTHHIISKANGTEGNEGKVEALAICPAFHVTEQQRRDGQEQKAASDKEQTHRHSLKCSLQEVKGQILWPYTHTISMMWSTDGCFFFFFTALAIW